MGQAAGGGWRPIGAAVEVAVAVLMVLHSGGGAGLAGEGGPAEGGRSRIHSRIAILKGVAVELVEVPPGEFRMGSGEKGEGPVHEVKIPADLAWALERLATGGTVRFRCGGEARVGPGGIEWGSDRFHLGGGRFPEKGGRPGSFEGEIAGTPDPDLYRTERFFDDAETAGYRIPVPAGRYRVMLHCAEIWLRRSEAPAYGGAGGSREPPGSRVFGVEIEGKIVLERYDPGAAGFATADRRTFETEVGDGFLDIRFVRRVENPKGSGRRPRRRCSEGIEGSRSREGSSRRSLPATRWSCTGSGEKIQET